MAFEPNPPAWYLISLTQALSRARRLPKVSRIAIPKYEPKRQETENWRRTPLGPGPQLILPGPSPIASATCNHVHTRWAGSYWLCLDCRAQIPARSYRPDPVTQALRDFKVSRKKGYNGRNGNLENSEYQFWVGDKLAVSTRSSCRYCKFVAWTARDRKNHKLSLDVNQLSCAQKLLLAYAQLRREAACVVCECVTVHSKWGLPMCGPECEDRWRYSPVEFESLTDLLAPIGGRREFGNRCQAGESGVLHAS